MKVVWEYKNVSLDQFADFWQTQLNKFGSDGWELVSIIEYGKHRLAFFKRPKAININM